MAGTVFVTLHFDNGRYRRPERQTGLDDPRFRAVLQDSCRQITGIAEIRGRIFSTMLYVPSDESIAYAETDHDGIPIDARSNWPDLPGATDYISRLVERCRTSDGLIPETQVSLKETFIPPRFEWVDHNKTVTWEGLQDHARVVIVGQPGSGKTSCIRRLGLELGTSKPQIPDTLPILIELRDFPVENLSTPGIVELLNANNVMDMAAEFQAPFLGGRILLLIDGLDEVSEAKSRSRVLRNISQLCRDAPLIRVMLTSRDATYHGELGDFAQLRLLPFDDARISQWIILNSTQRASRSSCTALIDRISEDASLRDLCENPLLLSLTTSLNWQYPHALNDRAGLVGKCLDVLTHDWDAARSVARWRDSDVTPKQMVDMLALLSTQLGDDRREEFTVADVVELTKNRAGSQERPLLLLNACRSSGLVSEPRTEVYRFAHQTFADYLMASHLVRRTSDIDDLPARCANRPDKQQVWVFSCALASDADDLLNGALDTGQNGGELIALALGNDITVSTRVLQACCQFIITILERNLGALQQVTQSVTGSTTWAVTATSHTEQFPLAEAEASSRLLVLLHQNREGPGRVTLQEYARASEVPLVRLLADLLDQDGWCEAACISEHGQAQLQVTVTKSALADLLAEDG